MILVTGASGNTGGAVVREIQKSNLSFRAMYRSMSEAQKAPPGVGPVIADFANKESLIPALAGIDVVFLVCAPIPSLVELESNVIDVAQLAGVKHIVLNSALGAGDYPKSFPSWHRQVEDKLRASGLGYTILRPNGFMQNIVTYNAPSIRSQSAFYAAMGTAATSLIDIRDIATVAAKALLSPAKHADKIYELNGPEAVSNFELAARISKVVGRTVNYVDIPESAQRASMLALGMPEWQVDALLDLQAYYVSGQCAHVTPTLESLLGQPPRTLDAYLQEFQSAFVLQL